jgi:hypothetical protein
LAGILVVLLAVGALLWPGGGSNGGRALFLVFDSTGDRARVKRVYEPVLQFLNGHTEDPLELAVTSSVQDFQAVLDGRVAFVLCPDGLGLGLDSDKFVPLAAGRRAAPQNLRPRGVLVFRKSAGLVDTPWISRPEATVCGDSLSLTATGVWRRHRDQAAPPPTLPYRCAWGPDPYDHAPVLHAARLGGFDYALVRQWDADRFFAEGLLSPLEWGVELVTVPVPDLVIFASRSLSGNARLAVGEGLSSLGRNLENASPSVQEIGRAVGGLNLVGFNLLVDPDFELVRRNFAEDWPPAGD